MAGDTNGHGPPASKNGTPGRPDVEQEPSQTKRPLLRSPFRALIQDFTPLWFTWVMNSGIISILLHQHPYQFEGIRTLSIIAFLIALVLFFVFSTCFVLRLAIFGTEAFYELTDDLTQLTLLACWPIGYLTLSGGVALLVSQAYWGGRWAMILAYVMWWIGAAWTFGTLFFVFSIIARRHMAGGLGADTTQDNTHHTPVPTTIIIPAVGVATVAVTGAEIVSFSHHMTASLAVPVIITAFPLLGLGMTLATFLFAILFRQLLEMGFPPPGQVVTLFVYIGPLGQSAAALQALGSAARAYFGQYDRGTFITESSAMSLDAACVVGALLLLGPAAFFTLFSIYGVVDKEISTRKVVWTPQWNAIIFPTATMTTATTYLSTGLDSSAFRVLTSIQLIGLVIIYFVNVTFTLLGIYQGKLLIVREDPRVRKQMEEEEKKR